MIVMVDHDDRDHVSGVLASCSLRFQHRLQRIVAELTVGRRNTPFRGFDRDLVLWHARGAGSGRRGGLLALICLIRTLCGRGVADASLRLVSFGFGGGGGV
jgi:hypothetical protein